MNSQATESEHRRGFALAFLGHQALWAEEVEVRKGGGKVAFKEKNEVFTWVFSSVLFSMRFFSRSFLEVFLGFSMFFLWFIKSIWSNLATFLCDSRVSLLQAFGFILVNG